MTVLRLDLPTHDAHPGYQPACLAYCLDATALAYHPRDVVSPARSLAKIQTRNRLDLPDLCQISGIHPAAHRIGIQAALDYLRTIFCIAGLDDPGI